MITSLRTALACLLIGCALSAQAKFNVLFIMTDDLNDYVGCYGGHPLGKTPNIDRLAKQGMVFNNAYCQLPLCAPSRTSMLTSLYPDQTRQYELTQLIRETYPNVVTMPQYFMQSGYRAARVGKIYHYMNPSDIGTPGHDDPASWEIALNPKGRDKEIEADGLIHSIRGGQGYGATLTWHADPTGSDEAFTDGMVASESIELMRRFVQAKEPFFLGVGFYKPHTPFVAPKKYFDLYDPAKIGVPTTLRTYFDTLPAPAVKFLRDNKIQNEISLEDARSAIHAYLAAISFVDAQVGRVLDAIEELGQQDSTVILFSSDHGYHMGEHGHYQKRTLFEEAARVPLIISTPGMAHRGATTTAIAEMVDFYPTLAELAGLPAPTKVAGISLAPVLRDPSVSVRDSALTQVGIRDGYSIRTKNFRYTKWSEPGPNMVELYDWRSDPDEMVNLANQPEYHQQLVRLEALWTQRVREARQLPEGVEIVSPRKR